MGAVSIAALALCESAGVAPARVLDALKGFKGLVEGKRVLDVFSYAGSWGVQAAVAWLVGLRGPLALGGGALLLWMAWQTWRAPLEWLRQQKGQRVIVLEAALDTTGKWNLHHQLGDGLVVF